MSSPFSLIPRSSSLPSASFPCRLFSFLQPHCQTVLPPVSFPGRCPCLQPHSQAILPPFSLILRPLFLPSASIIPRPFSLLSASFSGRSPSLQPRSFPAILPPFSLDHSQPFSLPSALIILRPFSMSGNENMKAIVRSNSLYF